jgi:hypothetical protein
LTDRQQAELLSILIERGGLEALGLTTDRSGREAFGLAADNGAGLRDTLLISAKTGRIIGFETATTIPAGDVPAGATTLYTIWEETN